MSTNNPFSTANVAPAAPVVEAAAAPVVEAPAAPATDVAATVASETKAKKPRKEPVQRMTSNEKDEAVKLIMAGGKSPSEIANILSKDNPKPVSTQQVRNLVQKLRRDFTEMLESDKTSAEAKTKIQSVLEGPLAKSEAGIGAPGPRKTEEQKTMEMMDILSLAGF